MATVSVRVPDEMRKRMAELDLDWSERIRAFIEEEIRRQEALEGLAKADAFRKKTAHLAKKFSMSEEVIRSRYEDH